MELTPEELLLAALVSVAIHDAKQDKDKRLREDVMAWLWCRRQLQTCYQ